MIFLDTATGLAALAFGGSLTLLWYFLKLRRRPLRVSSTVLWSRAARDLEVNAPLRWIRPSWLLFLQLLAVAMLAGAAGRPAMSGAPTAPGRWVLLIDRSASMSAADATNGGTRLDEAVGEARTLLRRLGSSERAMVASFAGSARLEAAMTSDRGVLLTSLDRIEPTDQPADFAAAIELVAAQVGEDAAGVRVVVFSDGGFPEPRAAALVGDADFRFMRVGPVPEEPSFNTGVVAFSARRDRDDPAALRSFVRIVHTGAEARDATVSVSFDGELTGAQTLAIEPGAEASAVFDTRRLEGGVLRAVIAGTDALESDNSASLVIPPARLPGAVVVSPDGIDADPFLSRAIEVATRQPAVRLTLSQWEMGAAPLASFVVFDRCEPTLAPEAPSLHLGAGAPFAGVRVIRYQDPAPARRVLAWERSHPAMRYLTLDAVLIADVAELVWDDDQDIRTLALSEDGAIAAAIEAGGARRLVFAFGPDGSNWETDPSFSLFVALAAEWLSPTTTGTGMSFTTAEGVSARAIPGVDEVVAVGPQELRSDVREDGIARFGRFERAGVYRLSGAEEDLIAVNLCNEGESQIVTRDTLRIAGQGVTATGPSSVAVRELWRWFVLAGLVLAGVEWFLYASRMRV